MGHPPRNSSEPYHRSMSGSAAISGENLEVQIETAAYHEAGHVVVATALGLRLRPEGIMVGQDAKGLACYWKEPDGTDASVEANILASFAGFSAEKRLRSMRGLQQRDYFGVIFSTDWKEARVLQGKFSPVYFGDKGGRTIHDELEARAEQLVAQHWSTIEVLAEALLSRQWEPKKPFKSGTQWSDSEQAKYLLGAEVVEILAGLGITAQSTPPL
jgi:hypothetical protein